MPLWLLALAAAHGLEFSSVPEGDYSWCPVHTVEIGLTGDMMAHGGQLRAARQEDGSYDMSGLLEHVAPLLASPDLTAANLETTLSGPDQRYTGYPAFNSPPTFLDQIQGAGVDLLQTANTHCLDRGELGIQRTLDALVRRGLAHTGTSRTPWDRPTTWALVEVEGLRVAFLAYTHDSDNMRAQQAVGWTNGIHPEQILADAQDARQAGAELVVVGLHWGREYAQEPDPEQRDLAGWIVREAGADVVWGTHPHVLQPAEVLTVQEPDGPRDALVLYSLGNFVSNQRRTFRSGGVLVRLRVSRCPLDGHVWLEGARATPVWVDDRTDAGPRHFRVLPAHPASCMLADVDPQDCADLRFYREHALDVLGLPLDDAPSPSHEPVLTVLSEEPWRFVSGPGPGP